MHRQAILLALALSATASAAGGKPSAVDAWKRLTTRYPVLKSDINIVRACPDVAGRELRQFIGQYPKSPRTAKVIYLLGRYHMSRREMSQARDTFWRVVRGFPQSEFADKSAHMIVGMYGAVGLWDGAHKQVAELRKAMPKPKLLAEIDRKLYAMEHMQPGKPPIAVDVRAIDDRPISTAAHKGKVVLLVFWATWCPPCRREIPYVIKAGELFGDRGLVILGVSLDSDLDALREYTKANGIKWPNYCDGKKWGSELALKFDITAVPQTYLIDREGKLRFKDSRSALLLSRVKRMIEGRAGEKDDDSVWE